MFTIMIDLKLWLRGIKTKGDPMANTHLVKRISECFLKPQRSVPEANNPIYLTPMELVILSVNYIQRGLLFTKPHQQPHLTANFFDNLKHSLSLALVYFYPLAGLIETRVDEDQHTSVVFVNCNKGPGAKLVHASLDATTSDLVSSQYVPDVVHSLFDLSGAVNHDGHTEPMMSVQVTELVDGVFIGCTMNHICADETSFWHFFNSWSEIFQNIPISRPPIHKKWFLDGTGPIVTLPFTNPSEFISKYEPPTLRHRFFHFSAGSISKLKAKANAESRAINNIAISSFQALSTHVWRSITRARNLKPETETKFKFHANYRGRLEPPLSSDCFCSAIQTMDVASRAGELLDQTLGSAALLMNRVVAEHNYESVRLMVEEWMQNPSVFQLGAFVDPRNILMGSSPRFDMYGPEFGMGKAIKVLSGNANSFDGKVTCYPGREGGGSVVLEISLPPEFMSKLESDEEFMDAVSKA